MKSFSFFAILPLTLIAAGCGASSSKSGDTGSTQAGVNECGIDTGFEGDENCIKPPNADEGIQIHFGPSSYDDPDALTPYVINPGDENVVCYNGALPQSDIYYDHQSNRMRPHSHHMRIFVSSDMNAQAGPTGACLSAGFGSAGMIPGSQSPRWDSGASTAAEDQGLARYLPKAAVANFEIHYINDTPDQVLREGWVNLYTVPQAAVSGFINMIMMVGDMSINIPGGQEADTPVTYSPKISTETRLYDAISHMHAHATQFDLYRQSAGSADWESIYTSFDWEEPLDAVFNTTVKNPTPDAAAARDGAISGVYTLLPGDKLKWVCHVDNTAAKNAEIGVPVNTLGFANEAKTAEMCMLVGDYVSPTPGIWSSVCGFAGPGTCF